MEICGRNGGREQRDDPSDIKFLKNSLTLDLQSNAARRRQAHSYSNSLVNGTQTTTTTASNGSGNATQPQMWTPSNCVLLESPDLSKCKLGTPEIERFLISSNTNGLTPTPSLAVPPSIIPTTTTATTTEIGSSSFGQLKPEVTEAQEQYARGFVDALQRLRSQDQCSIDITRPMSNSSSSTNTSLIESTQCSISNSNSSQVPTLAVSPPMSPINMEDQERIKLERKRMRNRIAASKCRRRKLEKIARLEEKVSQLKATNADLTASVKKLREHVYRLKEEVLAHVNQGCQIMAPGHHL
ncbi:early growth response 1-like protein [Dinothrombium tinctorium]|uniref:Early growth response 1-like protein n=1 Tax=Dinothrombium tinctorium TaxID=1965070 RepID=A0A443R8L0_9ACAR|nr:early growth response 1-like protein [Dinothrombium tinctorium]